MNVIILIAVVGLLYYLITRDAEGGGYLCERCEGKGYWRGLRGERNNCKPCNGTGQLSGE